MEVQGKSGHFFAGPQAQQCPKCKVMVGHSRGYLYHINVCWTALVDVGNIDPGENCGAFVHQPLRVLAEQTP